MADTDWCETLCRKCSLAICFDSGLCVAKELTDAGYEIHEKGDHEGEEAPVAARVQLGAGSRSVEGEGDQDGERGPQEPSLTQEELKKLRRHMGLWQN